jgi:hypothetical protein
MRLAVKLVWLLGVELLMIDHRNRHMRARFNFCGAVAVFVHRLQFIIVRQRGVCFPIDEESKFVVCVIS